MSEIMVVNLLDRTPRLAANDDLIQVTCRRTTVSRLERQESRKSKSYDDENVYRQSTRSVMWRKDAQECAKMRGYEGWDECGEACCRKSTAV